MRTYPELDPIVAELTLIDVGQVAQLLSCSVRHVYRLSDSGRMPGPIRIGALVRWSRRDMELWIEQGCPPRKEFRR